MMDARNGAVLFRVSNFGGKVDFLRCRSVPLRSRMISKGCGGKPFGNADGGRFARWVYNGLGTGLWGDSRANLGCLCCCTGL